MSTHGTKDKLLDAAEQLFAERGFDGASMRDITTLADANLASINYHFGSKESLLGEVIMRRAKHIVAGRQRMLDLAIEAAGAKPPTTRSIIEAFVYPTVTAAHEHPHFAALLSRAHYEGLFHLVGKTFERTFHKALDLFVQQIARALPKLPLDVIRIRLMFTVGAFAFVARKTPMLEAVTMKKGGAGIDQLASALIDFCTAGMEATNTQKGTRR